MATLEQMQAAVHAYVDAFDKGDPALVVELFAVDAVVEDPVGGKPLRGKSEFAPFFRGTVGSGARLTLDGPLRVGADYVAFAFHVLLEWEGTPMRIDVIDVFRFDDLGKVRHMQAFWGPFNFNPASQEQAHA